MAEIKTEVVTQIPPALSSPALPLIQAPPPQAETMIQAAIQTGAAVERAEQAASEAKESASQTDRLLAGIRETIRAEISPMQERLATLEAEAEAEEPITPDEGEGTGETASANAVVIAEPPKAEAVKPEAKQVAPPERKSGGGRLKKLFLNM
jgi:hypothetical protein